MLQIDLSTRMIPADQRVWRLFPGNGYKFHDNFLTDGLVYLDIPNFVFPEGDWQNTKVLLPQFLASQAAAGALRSTEADHLDQVSQSNRLTEHRGRIINAVINLYGRAKEGDLIVTPSKVGVAKVSVGRLIEGPNTWGYTERDEPNGISRIPVKRIDWIAHFDERKVSKELSASLRHEHPFALLERSLFPEVFSIGYNRFVYDGRHSSTIYNTLDDYSDNESALIGFISRIAGSICADIEHGRAGSPKALALFLKRPSIEYYCSQAAGIHSSGFNRLVSAKATPLIVVAFLSALGSWSLDSTVEEFEASKPSLEVINSLSQPNDPCAALVSEASNRLIKTMNIDELWKVCNAMKSAKERAGLDPGVIATPVRKRNQKSRKK